MSDFESLGLAAMQGEQTLTEPKEENGQELEAPKAEVSETTQEPETLEAPEEVAEEVAEGESQEEEPEEKGLPEEFKDYETLLKSRKWDPNSDNFAVEVTKAYQNAEKELGRVQNSNHQHKKGSEQLLNTLGGNLEGINQYRKQAGLSEIPVPQTAAERRETKDFLFTQIDAALKGDSEAIAKLNDHFAKETEAVAELSALEKTNKAVLRKDVARKANENYNKILSESPEQAKYLDELGEHFDGGLFTSLGIDAKTFFSDDSRMEAAVKIGEALHVFKNLEDIVDKRVKAELKRGNRAKAKGGRGGSPRETNQGGDSYLNRLAHLANVR